MHRHSHNEIIINKSGYGILTADGRDYPLAPGTVVCIPANMPHRDFSAEPRLSGTFSFETQGDQTISKLVVFYDHNHMVEKLFDLLLELKEVRTPYNVTIYATLGDAIFTLIQSHGATAQNSDSNDVVDYIDQLIRQNVSNPSFDLTTEINKTGYNPSYFRRIYRETFGLPPLAQLMNERMTYAKALMRTDPDAWSIKELSLKAGFEDPYYFSRIFRQHEHVSPSVYLQRCRDALAGENDPA